MNIQKQNSCRLKNRANQKNTIRMLFTFSFYQLMDSVASDETIFQRILKTNHKGVVVIALFSVHSAIGNIELPKRKQKI